MLVLWLPQSLQIETCVVNSSRDVKVDKSREPYSRESEATNLALDTLIASYFTTLRGWLHEYAREDFEIPGYVYLQRLSDSDRVRAVDSLTSKQWDLLRASGPLKAPDGDPTRVRFEEQESHRIYCRLLLGSVIHIKDKGLCTAAFERLKANLHPSFFEMYLFPGACKELGFSEGISFDSTVLDPELARRLMSCLLLLDRVPKSWELALICMSFQYLDNCHEWINYPLGDFPLSFWEWASERVDKAEGDSLPDLIQLLISLCQNLEFAAECIRRGMLKVLLSVMLQELTLEIERSGDDWQWSGDGRGTSRLICIVACLEIPEFDRILQLDLLKLASAFIILPVSHSKFPVELACCCNPKIASLIREKGMENKFGSLFRRMKVLDMTWIACFGHDALCRKSDLGTAIKRATVGSKKNQIAAGGAVLTLLRTADKDVLGDGVVFCDSFIRLLSQCSAKDAKRSSLLHVLVERGAHVRWLGVLKRIGFDLNTLDRTEAPAICALLEWKELCGVQEGRRRRIELLNLRLNLLLDPTVRVRGKDVRGLAMVCAIWGNKRNLMKDIRAPCVLLHLAKSGMLETESDVCFLYVQGNSQYWLFWDNFRAIWTCPPRLAGDRTSFSRILKHGLTGTAIPLSRTFVEAIVRASFLCGIVAMRVHRPNRRVPIAQLSADILSKLFRDHLPLSSAWTRPFIVPLWTDIDHSTLVM